MIKSLDIWKSFAVFFTSFICDSTNDNEVIDVILTPFILNLETHDIYISFLKEDTDQAMLQHKKA